MTKYSGRAISLLLLLPVMLIGQRAQQVPLKNWPTAQFWQPNQAEREAAAKVAPQFQLSANAVSNTALIFVGITPCRLVDTRGVSAGFNGIEPFSGPSINAGITLTIPVQSTTESTTNTEPAPCGVIPTIAQAYSFNLTVVPHSSGAVDYVSMWPSGSPQPFVATINDPQGAIVANAAIVPAGTPTGGISVFNDGPSTTDVIIDMNGYFAAPTDLLSNTAIGTGTLTGNTTGTNNTAAGADALQLNTSGSLNTAFGGAALLSNTTGSANTANGEAALGSNTTGSDNTASGTYALENNTGGNFNTAVGYSAMYNNTTGAQNSASGAYALASNTTGNNNTATGYWALQSNTTGIDNTANGYQALESNNTGNNNEASGYWALRSNTTGGANTADGWEALLNNTSGALNSAFGQSALSSNTIGASNAASGANALQANTSGNENTAVGVQALDFNTIGNSNIALGFDAALNVSGGNSNNIHIGNLGASGDSGVIKIGTAGTQTTAYIAGISGVSVPGGTAVYVTGTGQLGTVLSSRRFKEQITDMGDSSSKLFALRPVNFFYKPQYDDGSHLLQYGLIAEEVAKAYPEMVAYDKDGQILTVKYQMLAPMLLNEVQKQNAQIQNLEDRLAALEALLAGRTSTAASPANDR